MRIKRFEAPDTTTALARVKEEMGEDAVILASRTIAPVRGGVAKKGGETWVEVVAAMDYDLEEITGSASATVDRAPSGGRRPLPVPAPTARPDQSGPREREISIEAQDLRKRFARLSNQQKRTPAGEARRQPVHLAPPRTQAPRAKAEEVAEWRDRLLEQLLIELPQRRPAGKGPLVLALVGATGVGKTTTAAKLAAWYLLREGCKVALLSMDCYRIGATDQLRTYARIMRLPCEIALRKKELQQAIDNSYEAAGPHLLSIFRPEMRSSAENLARSLTGVFVINLATVTASGEPLVAPVDGLFYRDRLWFGLPPRSLRARLVRARSAVSATHMVGELTEVGGRCLIVHGIAEEVRFGHPLNEGYATYALGIYGLPIPDFSEDPHQRAPPEDFTGFIKPRKIFAQGYQQ